MRAPLPCALVLAFALTGPAFAQPHTPTPQEMTAQEQSVEAQARAQAVHPGDDTLTCDELQMQIMATVRDPTVMQSIQANGAMAQTEQAQAQQELKRQQAQAAPNLIGGMFSGFLPGGGAAETARALAQQRQQQAQYEQAMGQSAQMQQNTDAAMPQMMRGQHLYQLAEDKQCAFLQAAGGGRKSHR